MFKHHEKQPRFIFKKRPRHKAQHAHTHTKQKVATTTTKNGTDKKCTCYQNKCTEKERERDREKFSMRIASACPQTYETTACAQRVAIIGDGSFSGFA